MNASATSGVDLRSEDAGSLAAGLRVVKPMTYMSVGEYSEPKGCWIPSVLY